MVNTEMQDITKLILQSPVLNKLGVKEQDQLASSAQIKEFKKGDYIAHGGDVWPFIMIIGYGEINAMKFSSSGRSLGTLQLPANKEFWSPSLFSGDPLPASLEVWKPSAVYLWRGDQVLPFIKENKDALWALNLELARRLVQRSEFIEEIAFSSIAGRLARLLLDQLAENADPQVDRNMSLDEMGSLIGTTPVMVCKQIYRFAEDGLINVSRTEFELTNQPGLEEIADL
ncbi:MAG: Crp/Fnr family transcriptional regulator [Chloroflexota bacterium]